MTLSTSPIPIPSSPRSAPHQSAVSDAISTPVSSISTTRSAHVNAVAGPSRPSATRRSTPSKSPPSARKDWSPMTPASGSGAAVVSVAGKVGAGETSELDRRSKGVERGLSDLIIRSDRSPDKKPPAAPSTKTKSRSNSTAERRDGDGSAVSPTAKKGWGLSLVGGAVNAGVYGAALGVTAYKLWKQSSTQNFEPTISASASAPSAIGANGSPSAPRDGSILPALPAPGEIAPPPAYRERDQVDSVDWADELDDEDLLTPSTSRTPTVRLSGHQHPLLHNTPSRSWGKKRRLRLTSGGLPKRASLSYGEHTPPLSLPSRLSPESSPEPDAEAPMGEEAVAIVVEGQEDILDRLDGMTLRIQKLILEGQAALIRKPEEMGGSGHSRGGGSGSWGRRGRGVRPKVGQGQGQVVRSRRSLPVVGVTVGSE